jgi:hypothetical protein
VLIASSGSCQRAKQALVGGQGSFHAARSRARRPALLVRNLEVQPTRGSGGSVPARSPLDRQMQLAFAIKGHSPVADNHHFIAAQIVPAAVDDHLMGQALRVTLYAARVEV